MTAIVYERPDGGVSVVHPIAFRDASHVSLAQFKAWLKKTGVAAGTADTLDALWLTYVMAKDIPGDAVDIKVVDAADIPVDRTFRNALTMDLDHDMAKARDIWRDKIRAERAPKLDALDVAYQRADEAADAKAKADIAAIKQALRDATADPEIEQATTCAELKAVWPAALKD